MKKTKRAAEGERFKEIQQLQQRNNQLQTDFENAKVMTAQAQKKAKEAAEQVELVEGTIQEQNIILEQRTSEVKQTQVDIAERETTIERMNGETEVKSDEL